MEVNNNTLVTYAWFQFSIDSKSETENQNNRFTYNIPNRNSYERIEIKSGEVQIVGYYLGLQKGAFKFSDVVDMFIKKDWKFISELSAQFVLVIYDNDTNEFTVISDNTGTFPIYWATIGNKLCFSPNFECFEQSLKKLTVNIPVLLHMICTPYWFERETLFREVQKIPPSCFLVIKGFKVEEPESYLLKSKVVFVEDRRYSTFSEFQKAFFKTLELVVSDYLDAIGNKKYISDLSSGFDSSLVSFMLHKVDPERAKSIYSDFPEPFTGEDKKRIDKFVKKHNLNICNYTYRNNEGMLSLSDVHLFAYNSFIYSEFISYIKKQGFNVSFSGHGGDELYGMLTIKERYLQKPYVLHAIVLEKSLSTSLRNIFTELGILNLIDSKHYESANFFPSLIIETVLYQNETQFHDLWINDVCCLSPLSDIRIARLCELSPKGIEGKPIFKKEFWKRVGPLIHPQLYFSKLEEKNPDDSFDKSFVKEKGKILSLLESNLIKDSGLFCLDRITQSISEKISLSERDSRFNCYLHTLLKISIYIDKLSQNKKIVI